MAPICFKMLISFFYSKTNISQERLTKDMKTLFQLITLNNDFVSQRKVDRLQNVFEENRVNVSKLLEKLSPKCDQILKRCLWHGNPRRCSELFRPLKTLYGSCCAFNYYGSERCVYLRILNYFCASCSQIRICFPKGRQRDREDRRGSRSQDVVGVRT